MLHQGARKFGGNGQGGAVNSRRIAKPFQQFHNVFGRDIPARSGRIGATAKPGYRAIKAAQPEIKAGDDIVAGASVGIVVMPGERAGRHCVRSYHQG